MSTQPSVERRHSRYDVSVLIQGASGTGKDLAARAIHYQSALGDTPFVPTMTKLSGPENRQGRTYRSEINTMSPDVEDAPLVPDARDALPDLRSVSSKLAAAVH